MATRVFQGYFEDFVEGMKSFIENFTVDFIKDYFISAMSGGDRSSETNLSSGAVGGSGMAFATLDVSGCSICM